MGQALYRTYRSKKLSEIVGQEHITSALERALSKEALSHAYLFTGPRGTGKTSIARILAHEINGLPYQDDRSHLDIIEIDAASNRRIDEIRDLRDKVHTAPSSAKYKVYIIDEVHMLTKEAFNALLKTLEEPPAHVVFILATTEAHKLPETITSRTQRFAFKPVDQAKVIAHLRHIADKEGVSIDDDALGLIAAHGEGSFRDSISLLDQARHTGESVTLTDVQRLLGIAPADLIDTLMAALQDHDALSVSRTVSLLHEQGYEPAQIARQMGVALRSRLIAGEQVLPHDIAIKLLHNLVQVTASPNPGASLEITLLDAALASALSAPAQQTTANQTPGRAASAKSIVAGHTAHAIKPQAQPLEEITGEEHPPHPSLPAVEPDMPPLPTDSGNTLLDIEMWQKILARIKQHHSTLFTAAKFAAPTFLPGKIVLTFGYGFHQKRFNDKRNREIIHAVIREVTGGDIHIETIVEEGASVAATMPAAGAVVHTVTSSPPVAAVAPETKPPTPADPSVAAISNIFGGAEILES